MTIFWTFSGPKIAPSKPPALHVSRYVLSGTRCGGSQLFSTWDPNRVRWDAVGPALLYVGPYTPFGFYNAN